MCSQPDSEGADVLFCKCGGLIHDFAGEPMQCLNCKKNFDFDEDGNLVELADKADLVEYESMDELEFAHTEDCGNCQGENAKTGFVESWDGKCPDCGSVVA